MSSNRPTLDFSKVEDARTAQFELCDCESNSSSEEASTPTCTLQRRESQELEEEEIHESSMEESLFLQPLAMTQEPPRRPVVCRPVAVSAAAHSPYCGNDSGYQTDSPFTVYSGRSTDEAQGVFNMSLDDIPANILGAPTPPPGTFRPVSPADPYRLRHVATQTSMYSGNPGPHHSMPMYPGHHDIRPMDPRRFFRPASAPIYDIPDDDGEFDEFDEEVYNTAGRFEGLASEAQGPLPDLVDMKHRSQSVPLMEERRRQSIVFVADQLRHIGDEINRSRSPSTTSPGSMAPWRSRAQTLENPAVPMAISHPQRRMSNTERVSNSFPNNAPRVSGSWFSSIIRTISGADIESHDNQDAEHSAHSDPYA